MSLFDTEEFAVCPICAGIGYVYDEKVDATRPCSCQEPPRSGDELRDEGIERAFKAADPEWKVMAASALRLVAVRREKFTTDAIWAILDRWEVERPREPRAMAGVLMRGKSEGWCMPTSDPHVPSKRPEHHSYPLRVWASLIVGEDADV